VQLTALESRRAGRDWRGKHARRRWSAEKGAASKSQRSFVDCRYGRDWRSRVSLPVHGTARASFYNAVVRFTKCARFRGGRRTSFLRKVPDLKVALTTLNTGRLFTLPAGVRRGCPKRFTGGSPRKLGPPNAFQWGVPIGKHAAICRGENCRNGGQRFSPWKRDDFFSRRRCSTAKAGDLRNRKLRCAKMWGHGNGPGVLAND